ncbi:hypothetical protein DFH08DRAFT_812812 [Mycena albidolilacea]|uniref:Uncharacterized protein n=1 Tax=Mycena albidolilacea TaxID=1033008 RepID=A0AAD6ZSU9_9AGAR|nr:hypothetical protein DFH08DRAFT_812812 [Mycena albidolilacea]
MDIALDNQTNDVERLTARVAKLDMKGSHRNGRASARDPRLPDPVTRQHPFNVTQYVAVTTAAALNTERSAHKLKRTLFSVRSGWYPCAAGVQSTPKSGSWSGFRAGWRRVPSTPPQSNMPEFDFPEDNFNPSPPLAISPAGYSTPSPPPSFDWGPLPTLQKKPTPVSPENSLSGSWVSDGFGSKK